MKNTKQKVIQNKMSGKLLAMVRRDYRIVASSVASIVGIITVVVVVT